MTAYDYQMQKAPWWGIPVLAGLFALVGVFVAQLVALRIDRRKIRREDARRWDIHRQECYVAFMRDFDAIRHSDRINNEAFSEFMLRFQEVTLLASPAVSEAAEEMLKAAGSRLDKDGQADAFLWVKTSMAFIAAARTELGVVLSTEKVVLDRAKVSESVRAALRFLLEVAIPWAPKI